VAVAASVAAIMLGGVACGSSDGSSVDPGRTVAPQTTGPQAGLATLLVQPRGFVGVPDDSLSGPIGRADVGKIFVDHPDDALQIVNRGFVGGYSRNWKQPTATYEPRRTTIPDTTTIGAFVLQFDTEEHAREVLAHFHEQNVADGYQFFSVPMQLAEGYGVRRGPDNFGVVLFGVAWVHGAYLLNVTVQPTDPAASASQVIALAQAQEEALA